MGLCSWICCYCIIGKFNSIAIRKKITSCLYATNVWTLFEHRNRDEVFKAPFYQYLRLSKTVRFRSAALEWVASSLEFIKVWGDFFMFKSLVTFGYIIFLIIDICSHTIIVFSCSMWIIMLRLLNIWMAKVVLNILFTLPLIFCQWCTCESKFMCNDVRLNYACQRLENTSDSITNICLDSGFESQRTFNRVFKERYKISPSDYRSTCLKDMLS